MERAAYEVKDERYRLCIETIESCSIYTKFWTMSLFLKKIILKIEDDLWYATKAFVTGISSTL